MCLDRVFINQALNTLLNYGARGLEYKADNSDDIPAEDLPKIDYRVFCDTAEKHAEFCESLIPLRPGPQNVVAARADL
jgi:hypothetical protein